MAPDQIKLRVFVLKETAISGFDYQTDIDCSQTRVQRPPSDPEIVVVVDRWSLCKGDLCSKSRKWDLKMLVVI